MAQATQEPRAPLTPVSAGARSRRADPPVPVPASPARPRRRPAQVGVGVALIALGGLTSGWLVRTTSATLPVVAMAASVGRGEVIEHSDLTAVQARLDPSVPTVPAEQLDSLVGGVATTGLLAGSLLPPAAVTDQLLPGRGASLVGVALSAAQRPAGALVPGDPVRVVETPTAQADAPIDEPDSIQGEVVSVTAPDAAGVVTVDVLVPEEVAAGLAARAATGRVALVLDAREE